MGHHFYLKHFCVFCRLLNPSLYINVCTLMMEVFWSVDEVTAKVDIS